MDFTAIIKEAVELYIDEMGLPEELTSDDTIIARQKGSHIILVKETSESKTALVVPDHKEVDPGTLIEIIRQAGLKRDEFIKLLK